MTVLSPSGGAMIESKSHFVFQTKRVVAYFPFWGATLESVDEVMFPCPSYAALTTAPFGYRSFVTRAGKVGSPRVRTVSYPSAFAIRRGAPKRSNQNAVVSPTPTRGPS